MSIHPTSTSSLNELSLRLPLLAAMRVHQSATAPTAHSTTQRVDMWMADLGQPIKLSRWGLGFRNVDDLALGAFTAGSMAEQRDKVLAACGASQDARVLMLAHPGTDSDIPRVYWVVGADGACIGQALDLQPHLTDSPIVAATGPKSVVDTAIRTESGTVRAGGSLRSYLDTDNVRLGLQLASIDSGTPLMTVSMTGRLSEGNSRALYNTVTALAA